MSHVGAPSVGGTGSSGAPERAASVRAVFFDLYGTLIAIHTDEDDPGVYATLAQYLAYLNVGITADDLRRQYRSRVRAALERSRKAHPEVDVHLIFRDILTAHAKAPAGPGPRRLRGRRSSDLGSLARATAVLFRSLTRRSFAVFPEAHRALEELQATHRLGLISDAQWVFTDPELEMTDLARFFPVRVLSSHVGVKKPDARIFKRAMRALGVAPEESVYVGDNPSRDLVGARNAGMKSVILSAGDVEWDGLRPDAQFRNYSELVAVIGKLSE